MHHIDKTPALEVVLARSNDLCVELGLNYITPDLLCYATIATNTTASLFLNAEDKSIFLEGLLSWLHQQPALGKWREEGLPLIDSSYIVIYLAQQYSEALDDIEVELPHLLLSILSCDFTCTELLKKRGWVFKNYLQYLASVGEKNLELPDQLYAQTAQIPRKRKVPVMHRLFNSGWKKILASQYLDDALTLLAFKEYERSLQSLANASRFAEHDENFFRSAIYIYCRTKNWRLCLQFAEKAIRKRLDPDYFMLIRAFCLSKTGDFPGCIVLYKNLLDHPGDSKANILTNIGFALSEMGEYSEAIGYFDGALEVEPALAYAINNKGFCLHKLGDTECAVDLIQTSLQINKGNSYAFRNLALIAKDRGNLQQAMDMKAKAYLFGYKEDYGNDLEDIIQL